jgi:hypothetical protein
LQMQDSIDICCPVLRFLTQWTSLAYVLFLHVVDSLFCHLFNIMLPPDTNRCRFRYPKFALEAGAPPQSFDASYAPVYMYVTTTCYNLPVDLWIPENP